MIPPDETPETKGESGPEAPVPEPALAPPVRIGTEDLESYDAAHPPAEALEIRVAADNVPSWSWLHLVLFVLFGAVSLIVVQSAFAIYFAPTDHLSSQQELQRYFLSKPQFTIGSMLAWYAVLLLFLYVTIAVLPNRSFWRSLGWHRFRAGDQPAARNPWVFFLSGCALSVLVLVATAAVKAPENAPIQELMKSRTTALLFMAMAVLVAPLIEETIFRGYLYPLFAKSFGVLPAVIVTGTLFGLMHGSQLGWTWGLVLTLTVVGIVFTLVRARTGTVLASFLLHLGYNSMLAVTSLIATRGFTVNG